MSNVMMHSGPRLSSPQPVLSPWFRAGHSEPTRTAIYSQPRRPRWDKPLPFKPEVCVEKMEQPSTSMGIVGLTQSHTGLLAQEVVMVKQRARQVVTAMRGLDDQVRLFSWRVNADGALLRTGSGKLPLGAVQQIKMVQVRNYVVACRTQAGELHLSRWDVSNTGAIYLAGAMADCGQNIQWVEMVALASDRFAILALTTTQTWRLMLWQLQGDTEVTPLAVHEMPAALVGSSALAVLPPNGDSLRLATLTAEDQDHFVLRLWQSQPGDALALQTTVPLPLPDVVAVVCTHVAYGHFYIIVQTVTGQLRLVTWRLTTEGGIVLLGVGTVLAEGVAQCTSQRDPDGFALVYRTLAGELCVQRCQPQPTGDLLLHVAGRSADAAQGEVICCNEVLEGNAPLLTGVIDDGGEVTLRTWRQN